MKEERLFVTLALGIGLTLALLWILGSQSLSSMAAPSAGHVDAANAPAAELHVCPSGCAYSSVQAAVDAAGEGGIIKVATGTYTDVHVRPRDDTSTTGVVTQVVYISKAVTIQGGYTITNWTNSDPAANPTTLDAQEQGRVLYITGSISPTVEGLHITGGDAVGLGGDPSNEDAGGGVYGITATVNISNSQIFSNTAEAGGGLYFLNSANVRLTGNTITNNTGLDRAGGLYFRNSTGAALIANTISNNEANHLGPGQKHHGGAYFLSSDDATLINNTISDNSAADSCGGMTFRAGSDNAMLIGNNVTSNSAGSPGFGGNGGGLCFDSSTGANLIGNMVMSNSAFGNGGGLYLERSDSTMTNNVVVDNQLKSTGSGSGLYIAGSSPQLLHTTIALNSGGDGSGVCVTDFFGHFSTVGLTNTILVSHTVGLTVTAGNTATLNGVLWYSNTINCNRCTVTNEHTGNPAFAADGYHLTRDSAAIDRGVTSTVAIDIDGDARPQGSGYDLGADEFVYDIYLPFMLRSYVTS